VLALPGYPLLRTDQNGWIEVSTDGKKMWVETEKDRALQRPNTLVKYPNIRDIHLNITVSINE